MTSFFTLWDIRSGNFVEDYDDSAAALRAAAELIELNRPVYPDALLLRWTGPDGQPHDIAQGPALVALTGAIGDQEGPTPWMRKVRRPRTRRVSPVHRRRSHLREVVREPIAS